MQRYVLSLALPASSAAQNATSSVVVNPFQEMSTITKLRADSTATTYTNTCTGNGREPSTRPGWRPLVTCAPFILTQGPSTYELHVSDMEKDGMAFNLACKLGPGGYKNEADCSMSFSGDGAWIFGPTAPYTTKIQPTWWQEVDAFQTVSVRTVSATSSSFSASATSSSSSASATSSGSNAPGSAGVSSATSTPGNYSASTTPGTPGPLRPPSFSSLRSEGNSGHNSVTSTSFTLLAFIGGSASILVASVLL